MAERLFHAELIVKPKPGVRDPQGEAVAEALEGVGFESTNVINVGRVLTLAVKAGSEDEARQRIDDMCRRLLVNPNLECHDVRFADGGCS